jgi:hypothetical protein
MLTTIDYNRIRFHWQTGADKYIDSQTTLSYDEWHHIAAVMDGTTMKIYIDGVQDSSTLVNNDFADTTIPIRIGRSDYNGLLPFRGIIDDARVYRMTLGEEDIWALATSKGCAIQTQTLTVESGASSTTTFTWNTTGYGEGVYVISACAPVFPGETNLTDNTLYDGWVFVAMLGDLNADRKVDIFDIITVALAFNSKPGDSNWNAIADINNDNIVDIFDIVVVALHFGETG